MPRKNTQKQYIAECFYHVYNRGVNKRKIFLDKADYAVFLNLLKRYLDDKPTTDNKGREYEWLHGQLELLAFCLMPNHFHLLFYQHDSEAITKLMRSVMSTYTSYFNKRYNRVGPLFQSTYKAKQITSDEYLLHISRYIHLNSKDYKTWEFSSLPYYLGRKKTGWVRPGRLLDLFEKDEYPKFLTDYEGYKQSIDEIKTELANDV